MNRSRKTVTGIMAVALMCGALVFAGAQARIKGTVVDSSGTPIPDATITITCSAIEGYKKVLHVNKKGAFSTVILDATRHYKFRVEAPGFIPYEEPFKVPIGTTDNEFTFTLKTQQEMVKLEQQKLLDQPGYKEVEEAKALLQKGDKDGARAKLREAVTAKPDLLNAWEALARLDLAAGHNKTALKDATTCLDLDDESVDCLAVAINAAKALGKKKDAEAYMVRYQKLNPDDPATIFNEAAPYINKVDDEHARPLLEKCLEVDPDYPECIYEYGMLLLRSGDMAGAKQQLMHYLEVAPNGPQAAGVKETLKYL